MTTEQQLRYRRTPFGYLSTDGRWFLERGGLMTHGCNAWLIWHRTDEAVDPEARPSVYRTLAELTGRDADGDQLFLDAELEGGWLSEAKAIVERLVAR